MFYIKFTPHNNKIVRGFVMIVTTYCLFEENAAILR